MSNFAEHLEENIQRSRPDREGQRQLPVARGVHVAKRWHFDYLLRRAAQDIGSMGFLLRYFCPRETFPVITLR